MTQARLYSQVAEGVKSEKGAGSCFFFKVTVGVRTSGSWCGPGSRLATWLASVAADPPYDGNVVFKPISLLICNKINHWQSFLKFKIFYCCLAPSETTQQLDWQIYFWSQVDELGGRVERRDKPFVVDVKSSISGDDSRPVVSLQVWGERSRPPCRPPCWRHCCISVSHLSISPT